MKAKSGQIRAVIYVMAGIAGLVAIGYTLLARTGQFQLSHEDLLFMYADSESRFVTVKGIDVHYKDEGWGPVVLLLHGSFGSLRTWDGVVASLKDQYRLIRMDQPPSALSGDLPASVSGLSLEEFIRGFLDEIGVKSASLVGTSSGGIIAYRFAAKYPDRTEALVIANSPSAVVDNSAVITPIGLDAIRFLSGRIFKHQPKLYWRLLLESLYAKPSKVTNEVVDQYFDIGRKARTSPIPPGLFARVNDNDKIDGVLEAVRAPTLLLWGVPDPVLPEEMAHQLLSKLTAAPTELVLLRGTGHYPPVESPGLVAEQIRHFLTVQNRE